MGVLLTKTIGRVKVFGLLLLSNEWVWCVLGFGVLKVKVVGQVLLFVVAFLVFREAMMENDSQGLKAIDASMQARWCVKAQAQHFEFHQPVNEFQHRSPHKGSGARSSMTALRVSTSHGSDRVSRPPERNEFPRGKHCRFEFRGDSVMAEIFERRKSAFSETL